VTAPVLDTRLKLSPGITYSAGTLSCVPTDAPRVKPPSRSRRFLEQRDEGAQARAHVDGAVPLQDGRGGVLKLRSLVYAVGEPNRQVLDYRFTALQF